MVQATIPGHEAPHTIGLLRAQPCHSTAPFVSFNGLPCSFDWLSRRVARDSLNHPFAIRRGDPIPFGSSRRSSCGRVFITTTEGPGCRCWVTSQGPYTVLHSRYKNNERRYRSSPLYSLPRYSKLLLEDVPNNSCELRSPPVALLLTQRCRETEA
jgi:hypothetical protein